MRFSCRGDSCCSSSYMYDHDHDDDDEEQTCALKTNDHFYSQWVILWWKLITTRATCHQYYYPKVYIWEIKIYYCYCSLNYKNNLRGGGCLRNFIFIFCSSLRWQLSNELERSFSLFILATSLRITHKTDDFFCRFFFLANYEFFFWRDKLVYLGKNIAFFFSS